MPDTTPVQEGYLLALADILLQMRGTDEGARTTYEDGLCIVTANRDGADVEVAGKPLGAGFEIQVVASRRDGCHAFDEGCGLVARHMEAEAAKCFGGIHVFTFQVSDERAVVRDVHVRGVDLLDARGHASVAFQGEHVVGLVAARTLAAFGQSRFANDPVSVTTAAAKSLAVSTDVRRPGDGEDHVYWFTYNNILESGETGPPVSLPIRALDLADAQGLLRLIRPARGIRLIRIEITTLIGFRGSVDARDGPPLLVAPGVLLRDAVEASLATMAA